LESSYFETCSWTTRHGEEDSGPEGQKTSQTTFKANEANHSGKFLDLFFVVFHRLQED